MTFNWACTHLLMLQSIKHKQTEKKFATECCSLFMRENSFVFIHGGFCDYQPSGSRHQITGTPSALLSTFYLSNRKSLISFSVCKMYVFSVAQMSHFLPAILHFKLFYSLAKIHLHLHLYLSSRSLFLIKKKKRIIIY